jgi:DNA invertase Pin-like site-specific DNA recombinase
VRLDRLGRSLRELLEIVEQLKGRGVALVSLEEKIDTASAAGELVFHVFGAISRTSSAAPRGRRRRLNARHKIRSHRAEVRTPLNAPACDFSR